MLPKTVHAWEINGYAKITKELRDLIRNGLKEKYGSLHKAEIALKLSDYYHRKLHETFTRKDILFRLVKEAGIKEDVAERHIIGWRDSMSRGNYRVSFPVKLSIIHTRILSHIIGDGTITSNYTWCQKDVSPMKILQKRLFGMSLGTESNVITIPRILIKIIKKALSLKQNNLTKIELLSSLVNLPKEHRIQVLTAIIEDEGTCDINRITIRMRDRETMVLITKLIDSLNYARSNLTRQYHKRDGIKYEVWRVSINIKGIKRYWSDLEDIEKVYGSSLSLWKKREKVKELSTHKSNISGLNRNKRLRLEILKLGRFKNISFDSIKIGLRLTRNETMSLLRYMQNKGDINKIKHGNYKII
jgi:hypothetical protein